MSQTWLPLIGRSERRSVRIFALGLWETGIGGAGRGPATGKMARGAAGGKSQT